MIAFGKTKDSLETALHELDNATGVDQYICKGSNVVIEVTDACVVSKKRTHDAAEALLTKGNPIIIKARISYKDNGESVDENDSETDSADTDSVQSVETDDRDECRDDTNIKELPVDSECSVETDSLDTDSVQNTENEKSVDNEDCLEIGNKETDNVQNSEADGDIEDRYEEDENDEKLSIGSWSISSLEDIPIDEFISSIVKHSKRNNRAKLFEALKNNVFNVDVDENIVVLCYSGCEPVKTDGKINTHWIVVNPSIPFEIVKGYPSFPMLDLQMDEDDFRLAMESRLALYNEFTEDMYPIRQVAFSSIGKLLDSAASFKDMADIPLGSALLLADKLCKDMKELKFIFRNSHGHFKPLIGIAGNRFVPYNEENFFKKMLDILEGLFGIVKVSDWKICEDLTVVDVELQPAKEVKDGEQQMSIGVCNNAMKAFYPYQNDFKLLLRIQTSDIPGVSTSVAAVARFGEIEVQICKNSAYHWKPFTKDEEFLSLLSPTEKKSISNKICTFVQKFDYLKNNDVTINDSIMKKIKAITCIVGKRRLKDLGVVVKKIGTKGDVMNGYELFMKILFMTYAQLPQKQANELMVAYGELVKIL